MRWSGVWFHAVLLICALSVAWWSYTTDGDVAQPSESVVIWDLGHKPIVTVKYKMKSKGVTLNVRKNEAGDAYLWAVTTRQRPIQVPVPKPTKDKTKPKPVDKQSVQANSAPKDTNDSAMNASEKTSNDSVISPKSKAQPSAASTEKRDDVSAAKPSSNNTDKPAAPLKPDQKQSPVTTETKTETVTKAFRANEKADELLKALSSLHAKRALGIMNEKQLDDIKLKDPEASLVVTSGDKNHQLDIGMAAYGGGLRYVRHTKSGIVFALKAEHLDNLRWADSRLVERELFGFVKEQAQSMTVSTDGSTHSWDALDEASKTWLGKLFRLKVTRYVPKEENWREIDGKSVTPVTVLDVKLSPQNGAEETLTIARVGDGKKAKFFAKSTHTVAWVAVSNFTASELEKDLDGLMPKKTLTP